MKHFKEGKWKFALVCFFALPLWQICVAQSHSPGLRNLTFVSDGLDSSEFQLQVSKNRSLQYLRIEKNSTTGTKVTGSLTAKIPLSRHRGRVKLTAKLKTSDISSSETGAMYCMLRNNSKNVIAFDNMERYRVLLDSKELVYKIELFFDRPVDTLYFGFYVKGTGLLEVSKVALHVDSGEFSQEWEDKISMITKSSKAIDGLANLCKVWGLLKYHHPGIETQRLNWDSVLVNNIDKLIASEKIRTKDINNVFNSMISSAGQTAQCADCPEVYYADSLAVNLDLLWLKKNSLVNASNLSLLNSIQKRNPATPNRYVKQDELRGIPIFSGEEQYRLMELPGINYRLLALFRYWNAIQYFYPYKYAIGQDWNEVLIRLIPEFMHARTIVEYRRAICKLTASIHDGHAHDPGVLGYAFETVRSFLPVSIKVYDNTIIVTSIDSVLSARTGIDPGTELLSINGKSLSDFRSEYDPYISSSTKHHKDRIIAENVVPYLADSVVTITYAKDQRPITVTATITKNMLRRFSKKPPKMTDDPYLVFDGSIGYLNPARLTRKNADSVCLRVTQDKNLKAVIIDCREPQREFLIDIAQYFMVRKTPFARFNIVDIQHPGLQLPSSISYMTSNPRHFEGPVIVLTDATTISKNEFMVMALQANPRAKVVGNYTAGANGDRTLLSLPGGVIVSFSGSRVRYADGRETQRVGITPDIFIVPTATDIRMGKDAILEEAIRYIVQM